MCTHMHNNACAPTCTPRHALTPPPCAPLPPPTSLSALSAATASDGAAVECAQRMKALSRSGKRLSSEGRDDRAADGDEDSSWRVLMCFEGAGVPGQGWHVNIATVDVSVEHPGQPEGQSSGRWMPAWGEGQFRSLGCNQNSNAMLLMQTPLNPSPAHQLGNDSTSLCLL